MALADGAPLDASEDGKSVLRYAAEGNNFDIVLLLLEKGANPNEVAGRRKQSLQHWAVATHRQPLLEALLRNRAEVDPKDIDGRTPLHIAALKDDSRCIETLICRKSDRNIGDNLGDTPLHVAARHGKTAAVEKLLRLGAAPNIPNSLNKTPYQLAFSNRLRVPCELLRRYGADSKVTRTVPTPEQLPGGQLLLSFEETMDSYLERLLDSDNKPEQRGRA